MKNFAWNKVQSNLTRDTKKSSMKNAYSLELLQKKRGCVVKMLVLLCLILAVILIVALVVLFPEE